MERITTTEAASRLGIDQASLARLLQQHRNVIPGLDAQEPDKLPVEVVNFLAQLMRNQGKPGAANKQLATVIAVTSGKGGVGKTSVSVNIATELSLRGHRTVLVDVDLGLANAHILAGKAPGKTLFDWLAGRAEFPEIVVDGPGGMKMISGGSGVKELADLDDGGRTRLVEAIMALRPHCDVVILDTGAGISSGVTDFVAAADHTIVVTTSNFAAIADAYGIVKVLVQGGYRKPMHMVVNRVRSPEEAEQVFKKLQGCTQRFLNNELNWLGLLPEDHSVEGAVLQRTPFCEAYPASVVTKYLKKVVAALERYLPKRS
ncbi:MAG: P-loop NTPase [Planctomycetes bacterium]|nr:P-loop NTPase [Planctomycetota bacterium]